VLLASGPADQGSLRYSPVAPSNRERLKRARGKEWCRVNRPVDATAVQRALSGRV